MKLEIITEASTVQANGWVDSGSYYSASFAGNNPAGVKGCPMGRSQDSVEAAIHDLLRRVAGESQVFLCMEQLTVVRHNDYRKILELEKTPSGQFRYRIVYNGGVRVEWQSGTFQRKETIDQARERFSFDIIDTVSPFLATDGGAA